MRAHPRTIVPVQRVNHIPDMRQLYTKTKLSDNLRDVLAAMGPGHHPIAPRTWSIPNDADALARHLALEEASREGCQDGHSDKGGGSDATAGAQRPVYIIKPASGLQGRGIRLSDAPLTDQGVVEGRSLVVQQYVAPTCVKSVEN